MAEAFELGDEASGLACGVAVVKKSPPTERPDVHAVLLLELLETA